MLARGLDGPFGECRADNLVPAFVRRGLVSMLVDDGVRKCVLFIGTKIDGRFRPRATGFLVSIAEDGFRFSYLVTAEHVISGLQTKGHEISIRVNQKGGPVGVGPAPASGWCFHPENERAPTDVAVCAVSIGDDADVLTLALNGESAVVATEEVMRDENIGVGDEVAIIGMFRSHYGHERNIPVVRIANIAAMPEEPVLTDYCGYTDAYLIEARSIGGLSGSPVFVNMPPFRVRGGTWEARGGKPMFLLGLIHGHFDVKNLKEDSVVDDDDTAAAAGGINTGVGIVIPVLKIVETINHPDLVADRRSKREAARNASRAVPDA
jgi:hypothetical protein